MTNKKGGRPALPASQKRKHRIRVHFSDQEMRYLTHLAGEGGVVEGGIADYIRNQALNRKVHSVPEINHQAWGDLARSAANLNQIAHRLNLMGEGAVAPEIAEIQEALTRFRQQLLGEEGSLPFWGTESYIASKNEEKVQ